MHLLEKRVSELKPEDIIRLIENKEPENKTLDYKRELKLEQDKEKKEFLFDITSFYNTDGGCLIYGIEESKDDKGQNTGIPEGIVGVQISNYDKLTQKIEDIVRANTEPSISNLVLKSLLVEEKNILIIGIPKSLGLPTMVIFNQTNKFYKRQNKGKYLVDVYELNHMFIQNQLLKENVEKFRRHRIEQVRGLKVFSPNLETLGSYFIYIIPFGFQNEQVLDLSNAGEMKIETNMKPMFASGGYSKMFNVDGFATFSTVQNKIDSYDQLFRNGIYEVYTTKLFEDREFNGKKNRVICDDTFIPDTLRKINDSLKVLKKFKIEPPFVICISIHDAKGNKMFLKDKGSSYSENFMTDDIYLPPIVISAFNTNIYEKLKPIFDIVWQAVGESKSKVPIPK